MDALLEVMHHLGWPPATFLWRHVDRWCRGHPVDLTTDGVIAAAGVRSAVHGGNPTKFTIEGLVLCSWSRQNQWIAQVLNTRARWVFT